MRKTLGPAFFALVVLTQSTAYSWNSPGHRTVAIIAYRQLDDETKQRVLAVLAGHPAANDALWTDRPTNSPNDDGVNMFMNAATFPDDVRTPSSKFHGLSEPSHHFVDFRYEPPNTQPGPAPDQENLLTAFAENAARAKDTGADMGERAVALCWIVHLSGDVHQPLHCVSRFSPAFPIGDRGGNRVSPFPNPRGHHDLHSYWDDQLGNDHQVPNFAKLDAIAKSIVQDFPPDALAPQLGGTDVGGWAKESFQIAVKTVFRDLDPAQTSFDDLPVAYAAEANKTSRRQIALAGYRLARQLKALFPDSGN